MMIGYLTAIAMTLALAAGLAVAAVLGTWSISGTLLALIMFYVGRSARPMCDAIRVDGKPAEVEMDRLFVFTRAQAGCALKMLRLFGPCVYDDT